MQWSGLAWRLAVLFVLGISFRITLICTIFRPRIEKKKKTSKCSIAVFLGSGGHTSEMMQLIKALPTNRYNSRTYIMTSNDLFSMDKAIEYEKSISIKLSSTSSQLIDSSSSSSASVNLIILPRARNVHQKWLSTPISVLIAFAYSTYHLVLRPTFLAPNSAQLPDVILMNGPGTCVPIVAAVYILRVSTFRRLEK